MSNSDPSFHRQAERRFIDHIERLMGDDRLKIETAHGRKSVSPSRKILIATKHADQAVALKRAMIEMGKTDRELQDRMPVGESLELQVKRKRFLLPAKAIGTLRALSTFPMRELLAGSRLGAMSKGEVQRIVQDNTIGEAGAPVTLVILSTSGFTADAKTMVDGKDGRVILVEPNESGGFSVYGPASMDMELFNPEADADKRQRVREAIEAGRMELSGSGLAADKIVAKTELPAQLVEAELRSYAKGNPGLAAKRLDGRMVLFREGSAVVGIAPAGGVNAMPMIDKIRALFARRGETEKKIAFLSERRAALGQQRDRAYEEIGTLETKDVELREQFKNAGAELSKRRITSQLLQLRKDMERRQQLLGVLNTQMNVVSTHLHNLELVQQGETAKLPDSEEMASDAAAAEEMLAGLQESNEMAETVGGVASSSMNAEEQALYEELLRDSGGAASDTGKIAARAESLKTDATKVTPVQQRDAPRRASEPEAG